MSLNPEFLENREVEVENGWPAKCASRNVPNSPDGWSLKCRDIELSTRNENRVRQGLRTGNKIGPRAELANTQRVTSARDVKRQTAAHLRQTAYLPAPAQPAR